MTIDATTMKLFMLYETKYGNMKMKDIIKFSCNEKRLTFEETVDLFLFKNSDLCNKIINVLEKATRDIKYAREPIFPRNEYNDTLLYLGKKLKKCKVDGDAFKKTSCLIDKLNKQEFTDLCVADSFIAYKLNKLTDYLRKTNDFNTSVIFNKEKEDCAKYLDMTLSQIIEELK